MPRYRPPEELHTAHDDIIPLDTIATVIPRQSKKAGARMNIHSQELSDHELVALATSQGFQPHQVKLDKRDMGISANTTTIKDRPALYEWLYDALPTGRSKVVVFSQEDRAFRDEEEIELNTFIREVKRHRGWVVCGHKAYKLWEEYDADMFRMLCKYAAKYVSHHVRGRLLPAVSRAAQRGLYDGRGINIGYLVDYDPSSPTYKRHVLYQPHAELVLHEIFERFAKMPYPSVPALVNAWNTSNGMEPVTDAITGEVREIPTLYFPALPPETELRNLNRLAIGRRRVFPPYGIDDPLRRGWMLHIQAARRILSNIFYIGWVMRDGLIVRGEKLENGQVRIDPKCDPLVLHEPLVKDLDLFWYCFERVSAYTIDGQHNPKRKIYSKGERQKYNDEAQPFVHNPWPTTIRNAETNTLLLLGKLYCGVHGKAFIRHRLRPHLQDLYSCKHYDEKSGHRDQYCTQIPGLEVDQVVVQEFLDRLQLNDEDVQGIARAWQIQQRRTQQSIKPRYQTRMQEVEQEIENLISALALTTVETIRLRLILEMEKLNTELEHLRLQEEHDQNITKAALVEPLSTEAIRAAKRTAKMIETLRAKWDKASLVSRQALVQWVVDAIYISPDLEDRRRLDGKIIWRGGQESPIEIIRKFPRRQEWDEREKEVMRLWYSTARWEDLLMLLPGRERQAIIVAAQRMKLPHRPSRPISWHPIPITELKRLSHSSLSIEQQIHTPISTDKPGKFDKSLLIAVTKLYGEGYVS